jgi:hypothetical protein
MSSRTFQIISTICTSLALVAPIAAAHAQITRITDRSQLTPNGSITWDKLTSPDYPGGLPDNYVTTQTLGLSTGISGLTGDVRLTSREVQVFEMRTSGVSIPTDFALGTRVLTPISILTQGPLIFSLSADVDAIGVGVDAGAGQAEMRAVAYDAMGNVLDDFSLFDGTEAPSFMGFRSASGNIRRIEVYRGYFYAPFTDGVYIESGLAAPPSTTVPEPQSVLLVGVGMLLMAITARGRRTHHSADQPCECQTIA